MNVHPVFYDRACKIVVCESQESQIISVAGVDVEAVKHLLNVTGKGDCFFSEAGQHADQGVQLIRSLKQMLVKRFVFVNGAAVEHDTDLIWFSRMIDMEMGKKPSFALYCCQLVYGNSRSVAIIEGLFHKG